MDLSKKKILEYQSLKNSLKRASFTFCLIEKILICLLFICAILSLVYKLVIEL